ncbi:transcriptional regulator [Burkholderia lata]|nr:transcriptional regulator [Burkholderia lata]
MPRIDLSTVPERRGSGYPRPFDAPCAQRIRQRVGDAGGLRDFGVNLMRVPPGGWSSQRHWHSDEDEFVYVLEGELVMIEDGGETVLRGVSERLGQRPSPVDILPRLKTGDSYRV